MNLLDLVNEAIRILKENSPEITGHASPGEHTKSSKSRVKVFRSIKDGLKKGYVGQIFSTRNADRLYVVTKQKWGKSKQQVVSGRTAKGFSPGTIKADYNTVKGYAARTSARYSGGAKPETKRKEQRGQRGPRGPRNIAPKGPKGMN